MSLVRPSALHEPVPRAWVERGFATGWRGQLSVAIQPERSTTSSAAFYGAKRMNRRLPLAWNVVANALGRGWTALLNLLAMPLVVHFLGPERFGLVGFALALMAVVAFMDQALSPLLLRSLALPAGDGPRHADLVRSFESASWCCAAGIGGAIMAMAPAIAQHFLAGDTAVADGEKVGAIRLMGLWIAAFWPSLIYGSALVGLERQDVFVAVRAVFATVGAVGGLLLLWLVAPSLGLFLAAQALAALLTTLFLRRGVWRLLPGGSGGARFRADLLLRARGFAGGTLLIAFNGMVLTQAPGLIIAHLRPLAELAAYSLALLLGQQAVALPTQPVLASVPPRLVQCIGTGDDDRLAFDYQRFTSLIVFLGSPLVCGFVWFPREILRAWLGQASPLVEPVARLLPWMALGTLFNSVMSLPYLTQIAAGWTRLGVVKNVVAVAFLVPSLLLLVPALGPRAAAIGWFALNLGYYLIEAPLMHRRILRGKLWAFWLEWTLMPVVATLAAGGLFRAVLPVELSVLAGAAAALACIALAGTLLLLLMPVVRRDVIAAAGLLVGAVRRRA